MKYLDRGAERIFQVCVFNVFKMFTLTRVNSSYDINNNKQPSAERKPFSELSDSHLNTINNKSFKSMESRKSEIIEKYSRATIQHSKRSMNSVNIMNLSREQLSHSKIRDPVDEERLTLEQENQNDYLEGETLADDPSGTFVNINTSLENTSAGASETGIDRHQNVKIGTKRIPLVDRLPSFSFSYSFDPSVSVHDSGQQQQLDSTSAKNSASEPVNKEKVEKFVLGLKAAKTKYDIKKKLSENRKTYKSGLTKRQLFKTKKIESKISRKHSALSISVAESLLDLTKTK